MKEMVARSDSEIKALTAAEFLYYDAARLLENYPDHEGAKQVQALTLPIILGQTADVSPQVVLDTIISKLSYEENTINKEVEGKSYYLATIGLDSVGKAVVTSHLKEKYGFEAHPLSDRLVDIGFALGYEEPFDRDKLREISLFIKGLLGHGVLIRFAEALFARSGQANRVLFDGIRVPEEVTELVSKELNSDVTTIIIAIETGIQDEEADLQERFSRSLHRGSDKDSTKFEEFKERSMREAKGIRKAMQLAHLTVINRRGQQAEMLAQIDEYMALQGVIPLTISN